MIGLRRIRDLKNQITNSETRKHITVALNNDKNIGYLSEQEYKREREPIQPSMAGLQNVDDNPVVRRSRENCDKILNMPKKGNYFKGVGNGNTE